MLKTKNKHVVDLLDLPQKERVRLCKEIRCILQQKVLEGRDLQRAETETQQTYNSKSIPAQTLDSYYVGMKPLSL